VRVRIPAVSGVFYAGTAGALRTQIDWCYTHELGPGTIPQVNDEGPGDIVAIVVPHAGYQYSGPIAAHAYGELARDGVIDTAIILGPNHTGYGRPVSMSREAVWRTPLGDAEVDGAVADRLLGEVIRADETAHKDEHSIEVQLPWLQHLYGDIRVVPIAMMAQDIETARAVGRAIALLDNAPLVIASSDFSHYEPHSIAAEKDSSVVEAIVALDEEEMYARCHRLNCTMCGYGPVAAAIVAAREMGARTATLQKYATSGETGGDFSRVVGYGSLVMRR
jgi:MEMO1 family protein